MPLVCHERRDTQRVLGLVNRIRTEQLNLPPLKRLKAGKASDGTGCSIAASLSTPTKFSAWVTGDTIQVRGRTDGDLIVNLYRDRGDVPQYVSAWIKRFDNGAFPELLVSNN